MCTFLILNSNMASTRQVVYQSFRRIWVVVLSWFRLFWPHLKATLVALYQKFFLEEVWIHNQQLARVFAKLIFGAFG